MGKGGNKGDVLSSRQNLWYIHGKAYDLAPFIDKHPGGAYMLMITRGKECSALFESYHAPSLKEQSIRKQMEKYLAADQTQPLDSGYDWSKAPFYTELKEVVHAYRRVHGIKATDSLPTMAWYLVISLLHYATFACWALGIGGRLMSLAFGVMIWLWAADMMHSGTHFAMAYNQRLGEWLGWLGGFNFIFPSQWIRQHVTGHHVETNVFGKDPDLYMYYKPVFKQRPNIKYFTPFFTEIFPSFVGTFEMLLGSRSLRNQAVAAGGLVWAPGEELSAWAMLLGLLGVTLNIAWQYGFLQAALPFMVVGVFFYAFSQVSHINAESFKTPPTKEWAVAQAYASQGDYSYDSEFWTKLSIGLNNQALHHIFPSIHPCHYPALAKLMKPIFAKHDLPLAGWSQNFGQALAEHWKHMKVLDAF